MDDPDLMRRFAGKGDREALGLLFTRHAPEAYRTARLILRDPGASEDAVQEAFSRLLTRASAYDPARPFRPWLRSLVAHAALGRLRAERRRAAHEASATTDKAPEDPSMRLIDAETRARLREEIDRLPEDLRLPTVLHYQAGYTYPETAEALGCPEGTVATRLAAARERLKTALATAGIVLAVPFEDAAAAAAPAVAPVPATLSASLKALAASLPVRASPVPAKPLALAALGLLVLGTGFLGWRAARQEEPAASSSPAAPARPPRSVEAAPPPSPPAPAAAAAPAPLPVAPEAAGASLGGQVTCRETGRPVPDAEVTCVFPPPEPAAGAPAKQVILRRDVNLFETRTDAEGRYRLGGLPDGQGFRVILRAPGHVIRTYEGQTDALAPGEAREIPFVLSRGWGIRLSVRGFDGKPARRVSAILTTRKGPIGMPLTPNGDGYEILGLDPGAYPPEGATVTVSAPGSLPSNPIPLDTAHCVEGRYALDVTLRPGRVLVGVVLGADGAPASGARVVCWPADLNLTSAGFTSEVQEVRAGEGGGFQIEGLPVDRALSVWAQDPHAAMRTPTEIPAGTGSATLKMDAGGQVSGRILDAAGRPLPGARVRAEFTQYENIYGVQRAAVADGQGRYALKGLPDWPGLRVVATLPGSPFGCELGWIGVPVGTEGLDIALPDCSGLGKHGHPEGLRRHPGR